jgi:RNA polymerase sigma-70 factor (ECF subfamily)
MLGSLADADEVVHDVFLRLFESKSQFLGQSRVSTYLYSAVTHACLNRLRDERTRARLTDERKHVWRTSDPGTSPEAAVMAHALLAELPEKLAAVAVYYYLDEMSQREIAHVLGCSHSHVGHLLAELGSWLKEQEKMACPL